MRSVAYLLLSLGVSLLCGCRRGRPPTNEVVAVWAAKVPLDPFDRAWDQAPEHLAKLIPQDLVEPRLMQPSTAEVRVQALASGGEIAFRLRWQDAHRNDAPRPGEFVDACAVQLPRRIEREPLDPQMGQAGRPVEITLWRADWQAWTEGRGDSIRDLYPNAAVDHYPFEARSLESGSPAQEEMARSYAPARTLGNSRSGPRQSPVEDLVAEGPGTLAPSPAGSKGKGARTADGWAVVLSRRLPTGLAPRARTQVAFAVWEGSREETGSRKMRTGWIPLLMRGEK